MAVASDLVAVRSREADGWELREVGPEGAEVTALLLPGGMCSAAFYDDVLAYAALQDPGARLVAATPPGFAGRPAPQDLSVESFVRLAGELAARLRCRVLGGDSLGANFAIELAASGTFKGPVLLLSPSFSREDEFKALGVIDRIGRVPGIGRLLWALVPRLVSRSLKSGLPPEKRDSLAADLRRNEPQVARRMVRRYFEYLDRTEPLVGRLCGSGARAWVVFGDHDEAGLTTEEREELEACPQITLEAFAGASHMVVVEEPRRIAEIILGLATRPQDR